MTGHRPTRRLRGWLADFSKTGDFTLRVDGARMSFLPGHDGILEQLKACTLESVIEVEALEPTENSDTDGSLWAQSLRVIARAEALPFSPAQAEGAPAAARSRYRYLALREGSLRRALLIRHRFVHAINNALDSRGFIGVETPLLAAPSASGAREFSVSTSDGSLDYALPQSAQLWGQLLIAGGIERYFQWSRCFRDEDMRADRQSEFTQLHLECAFCDSAELRRLFESVLADAAQACGVKLIVPFEELAYDSVLARFGDDRPDLRWGLSLRLLPFSLADTSARSTSARLTQLTWREPLQATVDEAPIGALIAAALAALCPSLHVEMLGWAGKDLASEHFLPHRLSFTDLRDIPGYSREWRPGCRPLLWGEPSALDTLHLKLYRRLRESSMSPPSSMCCAWIVEYPLFTIDTQSPDRLASVNSPYTAPADIEVFSAARKHRERLRLRSSAFDLVCDGQEVASGSTVITDLATQRAVFEAMGLSRQAIRAGWGVWLDALRMGVPPMTGIGLGLERFVGALIGEAKIRSVIAFPKTKQGLCPVTMPDAKRGERAS